MNILIIGGAGYIGAHAVLEVLDKGNSVVVFDNFSTGQEINIDSRALIFRGDILSKKDLEEVFGKYNFDAVMHFCALKAPEESMIKPEIYSEVNITGSLNIINVMLANNVNKIIFSSSSSVYGEPLKSEVNENHPLNPVSFYGFTKLNIERVLKWYSKITNLRFVSLRYFNAAGYDLKGRIPQPEYNAPNLIPKIMRVLKGQDKVLKVFGSDYKTRDGTCIRDYVHVTDLARAHVSALSFLNSNKSLFLNLAAGIGHTILEVITKVEELSGQKVNYIFDTRREGDPSKLISSSSFKVSPINWKPFCSDLDVIINSVLNVYKLKNS